MVLGAFALMALMGTLVATELGADESKEKRNHSRDNSEPNEQFNYSAVRKPVNHSVVNEDVVRFCIKKKSGAVRYVDEDERCKKNETSLVWDIQARQGEGQNWRTTHGRQRN